MSAGYGHMKQSEKDRGTAAQLRNRAAELDLEVGSKMNKDDLVATIRSHG